MRAARAAPRYPAGMEPGQGEAFAGETFTTQHRGPVVLALAVAALCCAALACSCCPVFLCLGIPLAVVAWVFAEQDLRGMRAGTVDATGRSTIATARALAIAALCLAALWVLIFAAGVLFALLSSDE